MEERLQEVIEQATNKVQKAVQSLDLKRKLEETSTQPAKKPKLDSKAQISKLSTLREIKKQEKAGKPRFRSPWPPIFEHEGSPKVIVASFPATPQRDNSPFKENREPLVCLNCPEKDSQLQILAQKLEYALSALNERESCITQLEETISQAEEYRKHLHSQLVELKGPIRVMCRLKPVDSSTSPCLSLPESTLGERHTHSVTWSLGAHKTTYLFDRVFSMETGQEEVFDEVKPYIQSALDGDHVCIFTYGQTGSGKTYTLEGPNFTGTVNSDSGVVPRAALYLFNEINRQNTSGTAYTVQISCLEIYNDALYDLFTDSGEKLSIKTIHNKVIIEPLTWYKVTSSSELLAKLASGVQLRSTRETHLNASSSRSHCLYQLTLEGTDSSGKTISGKLNIIDLAGSERSNIDTFEGKSQRELADMKSIQSEAKFINTSLSCLRRVVSSLIANKARGSGLLPPFRESKLTMILQDSLLMPDAKVLVIVNVCSGSDTAAETRESLKFGSDAQFCLS